MRRLVSVLLTVLLLFSSIHTTGFAKNDVPFEVTADGAYLEAIKVGTGNIPELDKELQGLLEYMPEVYLVTIPFGCDEIRIKATDDALIMGETSDSQVLTDAEPDENGYYSIGITITEEQISSGSQWKDEGFEFFMDPEIPLFSIESGRIPTENVEGFFYYFLKEYTNSDIEFCEVLPDVTVVFQRSTMPTGAHEEVNKSELQNLITAALVNYYRENDRYNGKPSQTITDRSSGFWTELNTNNGELTKAQEVYNNPETTQTQVDETVQKLATAIEKLIPITQLNATKLYEAIQDYGSINSIDGAYTAESWNTYQTKLTTARNLLSTYFNADGKATEANKAAFQEDADTAADALIAAAIALDKRADEYMIIRSGLALAEIRLLADQYDPAKLSEENYTADSWQAFVSARAAALAVYEQSDSITELSEAQFEAQATAMDNLRRACYGLTDASSPITVHVSVTDSFAPRQSNPRPMNIVTRELTLPAGTTIAEAISKAGISLTRIDAFQDIAVYINGLYFVPDHATIFGGIGTYGSAGLRNGDSLTISFYEIPWELSNDGTYRIAKAIGEYKDEIRYQTISAPTTVKAGEPFELTVMADGAMPENYTGTSAPVAGAEVYASAAFETRADAETAAITSSVHVVTDADGKAEITLYAEGWCAINAFSTGTEAGAVCNGPSILIYVEPTDDLVAVKDALREELTTAYQNENYPEIYFSATDWQRIQSAYSEGMAGIADATSSGAARDAEFTALQTILDIQTAADRKNSANLQAFLDLLNKLPEDVEKLDAASESTVRSLISCYDAMTEYQLGQLTPAQQARYKSIKEKYDNGFAAAVSFQLKMEMDYSKVNEADREALAAMVQWLQDNTAICDTYSEVGGTKLAGLFSFNIADSLTYVGTTFTPIETSTAMQQVAVCVSPDYAAYLHVRDAGGTLTATDGSWSISDQSLKISSDDVNIAYVTGGETYIVNGTKYEVQSIKVSGLDADQFVGHTYNYYDSSDYMGKDVYHINMSFPDAFRRFEMPYNDVTVTVTWGPVSGTNDEITAARESAAETIKSAYANYQQSDYSEENWNTLTSVKDNALAQLQTAASLDAVGIIRQNALADMASVKKLSGGTVDLPDFGSTVGQVYISVENTTFPDCPFPQFTGEFLAGWYDLCAQDTMMTSILKALKTEGFSWEGTGGPGTEYGITYLSRIYIDSNGNGKYDSGEPRLGQFDGENGSGWMGTLNDFFVNSGFSEFAVGGDSPYVLEHGDEIKVVYTQNLGVDVGGTWNNSDTSLSNLQISQGTLSPAFESGVLNYNLIIPESQANITVTPSATNMNFLVKTFLNFYDKDAASYKRTETIFVKPGDVIYVGVGEQGWPSMNSQGAEAGSYTGTKYTITVYADGAEGIVARIDAAYRDIDRITYEHYSEYVTVISQLTADYDALPDKSEVTNLEKLTALQEKISFFKQIDDLKAEIAALPGSVTLTDRDAVETAKAHYDALTAAQKNLLTVAETNKLLKAVNTLAVLDALAAIDDTKDFASTEANTQAAVKTALEAWLNNADAAVAVDSFTAAEDGTAENLDGTPGRYSATVTVTIGSGAVAASGEKTVTGSITPVVYVKSSDTGVQSIKVNGAPATGVGTAYAAVLPYGSDMATASFEIVPADKATASAPETNDGGETWTFTVTAEDGTTAEYTVTLSVNSMVVTVLECGIYTVTPDVTVTELSPAAVSGLLEAVSTDALDLPQGTESVALWLSVTATAKDGEDITIRIEPIYAADNAEGQAVPAAALIGQITVTIPIPGTEYSKVLAAGEYLDAEGTESGITFTITAAGEYTLIPDAHIAAVTWHLNGGTSAVVTDGQQTIYFRSDDGADLPEAEKTGFTFKGWHSEDSIDSVAYIAVSAQLPAGLYAVWQSGNVNAAVTVSGVSAVKSGSVYTVTLPYGSDYPKAVDISITPEDAAATYTKPMTGDDGASWSFTVTAEDGTKQEYTLQVVIAEQTAEDILAAAKETIEGTDWNTEQQTANDAASLKAFVENKLAALDLGAAYTVTVTSVTTAVAGDAENAQGAAGSYSFTVTLTAGEASETAAGSGSISATAYVAPAQQADYITALNAVLPYLRSTVTNPIVGSTYGEWAVLALNRGNAATEAWNNIYLSNLKAYADQKNGVLAEKNYTEYSRVILALTSMGVDATKFATESGTYDLVKPLLDKQASGEYWAEWQGNNGTAFALLAADSHDYLDTAEGKALRAGLIASLKANQMASGAWAISGTSNPDLDVTAAAIYALAPYYLDSSRLSALGGTVSYAEVKAMVDSALAYLSGQQNADGGFGSVEADVWAIIALSTLGRDADTAPAFVKNGKSLLADMLSYQEESSGAFRHLLSGSVDQMATEEAAYGLVAYDRFKNGRNTLYDMSDVEIASLDEKANKAAAEEVEALIDAIGEVTLESKAKIDAARAAYDALTDEQKALVGNLQTLKDAEAKYQELAEAADQEEIDKAAAKGVDELIDAIGEVTLDSEKAIKAARNAYDALTDEQKKLVEKLADLEAAEAKLEELQPLVTVTFYLQSGKSSEVAEGETKTYTKADEGQALPTASRDNYSFDGWYDAAVDGTRYTSVSAALPRELYAQWTSDSSGDSGSGGGGDSDEGKITVTMRLIGAKQAEKDVDLGAEEYMPDYVTWIATTSYKLEEGSSVYDLWLQATGDAGIRSVGAEKNYVSAVFAPSSLGGYELAEFTNGKRSGWMYTINGRHPGFGLKEQELHDGDRVIWHYVNDYSYEVSDWFEADSRWPSLGDGRYYNRWLKAPDRFGGSGGGLGEGAQSSGGSGDSSGGSSEIIPSYDGDTIVIKADVEHSEGGAAYAADATLDKKTVAEGLEKAEDKSSLKVWVDIEDSNRLVLRIEPEAMKEIADAKAGLRMECSRGVIKLDADAVAKLTESGHEVRMVVSYDDWNDKTMVSVRPFPPTDGDAAVMLKIELPATKDGQALSIVGSDGTTTPIKKSAIIGDRVYAEVPSGVTLTITESDRYWNDVKAGDWFADAVSFAVSHDLMNGVDRYEFAPNMPMTRAMLVTVLYRLEDEPEIAGSMSFGDVASGAWYTEAVAWAAEQEIVRGNGDGFAPNDNITREQIATVLYRYAQYLGMDVEAKGDVSMFSDGEKISSWAQDAMAWAVKVGLFKGDDTGSLNPQGNATRAEVATLLERLIKLIVVS